VYSEKKYEGRREENVICPEEKPSGYRLIKSRGLTSTG